MLRRGAGQEQQSERERSRRDGSEVSLRTQAGIGRPRPGLSRTYELRLEPRCAKHLRWYRRPWWLKTTRRRGSLTRAAVHLDARAGCAIAGDVEDVAAAGAAVELVSGSPAARCRAGVLTEWRSSHQKNLASSPNSTVQSGFRCLPMRRRRCGSPWRAGWSCGGQRLADRRDVLSEAFNDSASIS